MPRCLFAPSLRLCEGSFFFPFPVQDIFTQMQEGVDIRPTLCDRNLLRLAVQGRDVIGEIRVERALEI